MKTGKIRSYAEDKRYGFIQGEDGESYFFHKNDVTDSGVGIKANKIVVFDANPTPKGMAARQVEVREPEGYIYLPPNSSDMIFSKTLQCGKGNAVLYNGNAFICEDRSPDKAKSALLDAARAHGFNAVLNVVRDQRAQSSGNYTFTVHSFTGTPALVRKPSPSMSPMAVSESEAELQSVIDQLKKIEIASLYYPPKSQWNPIILLILAAIFMAFFLVRCQ